MAKTTTDRLKCNPPLGRMPVLQFMTPGELAIDPSYQRSIEAPESRALIRRIAQHWNWDLCQPLVVARRGDREGPHLFVIDGQHRLEAARQRGDIAHLPCVVVDYACAADEAASFVHLNQQRRALGALDLFKAAVASDDSVAVAIAGAIEAAGLTLAAHSNHASWKPGQVAIIGGIQRAWQREGAAVTGEALQILSTAFAGTVLRYAGTVWPGIVALAAREMAGGKGLLPARFAVVTARLGKAGQYRLRERILTRCGREPELGTAGAAIRVILDLCDGIETPSAATDDAPAPAPLAFRTDQPVKAGGDGKAWCAQCDKRVSEGAARACRSQFCSLRQVA